MTLECPCGETHELSEQTRVAYENVTAGLPLTVSVQTREGCWKVPRIYMAVHRLKPGELPALAVRYGFAEVR